MNITINQSTANQEIVNSNIISKLYNLISGNSQHNVTLSGNLYSAKGYKQQIDTLVERFSPNLIITVSAEGQYLIFEDPQVENILKNTIGDGVGITVSDAANVNLGTIFQNNTTITSFNEFPYFTKANINPPANLFEGCTNLEEIDLSQTTKISDGEFLSSGIKEVDAPSLIEIGQNAFRSSSVETVTSLGNIVSVPFGCFMYCNDLQTVQLPSSVTTISPGAFSPLNSEGISSLTYINLNNVTSIDNSAFTNCKLLNIDASDLSNLVSIGGETFSSCFSIHGELNMPNLISAANKCFNSCSGITKVKCLGKITAIPEFFMVKQYSSGMALTEVYLPYECTSIQWNGFNGCSGLTTIKQYTQSVDNWVNGEPSSYGRITRITTFGDQCFQNCSSLTITAEDIQNAVTIRSSAFLNSGLTGNLNLPNLTSLGQNAFQNTRITSIVDLGSITSIPDGCFKDCTSLTSVILPSTCLTINGKAFDNCSSLTTLNAQNIKTIGGFESLRSVAISNLALPAIETIGQGSLSGTHINILDLGPNLSSIGTQAFWNSTYSTFIFRGTTVPSFSTTNSDRFLYNMSNVTIYVPESALNDYKTAWPAMASNIVKIEGSIYDTQS